MSKHRSSIEDDDKPFPFGEVSDDINMSGQIDTSVFPANPARDQIIAKLQNINGQLRTKIKDLNMLVEKALEKQTKSVGKR